tara:strand:+ start:320 stop:547 length:228 start_codon:yes stop_codon:yes gene_type:complete
MKAIIEFDLDNMDDVYAHKRCAGADDMAHFIWELTHNFYRKWKHDDSNFNLETYNEALNNLLEKHNIDPNEFWHK